MNSPQFPVWQMVTLIAWVIVGLYFIVSAFATQRIQRKEARGKRAFESFLIWGGYVALFPLFRGVAWNRPLLPSDWMAPVGKVGAVLAITGLALTLWARITLGKYWSRIVAVKEDHKLVQSGPYWTIRHPLYTGLLAASLGTAMAFGLWRTLIAVALLWSAFIWRAQREDDLLANQFGATFAAYRARSGRLLPRF